MVFSKPDLYTYKNVRTYLKYVKFAKLQYDNIYPIMLRLKGDTLFKRLDILYLDRKMMVIILYVFNSKYVHTYMQRYTFLFVLNFSNVLVYYSPPPHPVSHCKKNFHMSINV